MANPQPPQSDHGDRWPACDEQPPGVSIRLLGHGDLQALLTHLHHHQQDDEDEGLVVEPAGLRPAAGGRPVVAVRVRASVGRPGASAQAEYRRRRAAERARWTRSLPWRAGAVLAVGIVAGLLGPQLAPDLAGLLAVAAAAGLGWRLRFRPSADTLAWRRGATGERRTARLLGPLERRGWAVLHDLTIPGSAANIDHLVIGPGGVLVIDSKRYRGRLRLDRDGMVWHGRHLLVSSLRRAPASPGACCRPTASPSSRPGGCPTCCRPAVHPWARAGGLAGRPSPTAVPRRHLTAHTDSPGSVTAHAAPPGRLRGAHDRSRAAAPRRTALLRKRLRLRVAHDGD
jgi:hypothetical protein